MSTITNIASIKSTVLSGYTEVDIKSGDLEDIADTSKSHKAYQFRFGEPDRENLSSNVEIYTDLIILKVQYLCKNNLEYLSNYALFKSIYDSIRGMDNFISTVNFTYEPKGQSQSIGEFQFYFGVMGANT